MEKDIVPELLELIETEFDNKIYNSEVLKKALKALKDKKATYKDANDFAIEVGEILAGVFGENITADILPDGKMYYNIADRILNTTMGKNYELISGYAADVQTELNHNAGLKIKGIKAELNKDRIKGIVERVSKEDDFDEIKWILDAPIVNFSQSIVDDTIQKNAEFHAKSGLNPEVVRRSAGKCCDWCNEIVGIYKYPDVPKDVYRRHDRCKCTVTYDPKKGKAATIHSGTEGNRRYVKDQYGGYELSKEARTKRAQKLASTEKERKKAARQKRIDTWARKKELTEKDDKYDKIEARKTIGIKDRGGIGKEYLQSRLDFIDPITNEKLFIPNKAIIENSKTIAQGREIRVVDKLVKTHGGRLPNWEKRVGKVESQKYIHDVHWYENNRKQYEAKVKLRKEKR